jgi:hypothetical protein
MEKNLIGTPNYQRAVELKSQKDKAKQQNAIIN